MNGTADKRKETLCPFLLSFIIEGLKMKKKIKWSTAVFLIIYLMILAYVCFFSEDYGRTEIQNIYQYNLIPFKEITRFYTYRELVGIEAFMLNLLGNVIAFIPFGFMIPIVSLKNRVFFRTVGLTFLLSLFIECIQLIARVGSFDVDDLMLNTLGGIIGHIIFWIMYQIRRAWLGK